MCKPLDSCFQPITQQLAAIFAVGISGGVPDLGCDVKLGHPAVAGGAGIGAGGAEHPVPSLPLLDVGSTPLLLWCA